MPRKKRDYRPLPGFPVEDKFETMAEVETYLSGNIIQCRECGHYFSGLARHITCQHEINADEYKEKHGIPWGLVCGALHTSLSEKAKEECSVSHIGEAANGKQIKGKQHHRKYCRARVNAKHIYSRETYYEFADRVRDGEPVLSISMEEGMPSTDALRLFIEKDAEFGRYWKANAKPSLQPWRKKERQSLKDGRVQLAIKMAADGAAIGEIVGATGYSEGNARLFKQGKNWPKIRVTGGI